MNNSEKDRPGTGTARSQIFCIFSQHGSLRIDKLIDGSGGSTTLWRQGARLEHNYPGGNSHVKVTGVIVVPFRV